LNFAAQHAYEKHAPGESEYVPAEQFMHDEAAAIRLQMCHISATFTASLLLDFRMKLNLAPVSGVETSDSLKRASNVYDI
jgi:hypothetical protein